VTASLPWPKYKKLALVDTELSVKSYGEIYATKVIQVGRK